MMPSALLLLEEDLMISLLLTNGRIFVRTEGSTIHGIHGFMRNMHLLVWEA